MGLGHRSMNYLWNCFMPGHSTEQLEAVIFFKNDKIDRELQYPEFEAVMDGYVPILDYASSRARAVYIYVNREFCITTAVFFYVDIDEDGMVAKGWNVPFQQLASKASRGPNLGAGAIRLACFSQCPVTWHKENLWDPHMEPGRNSFVLMRKAVAANRLGLIFSEPKPSSIPDVGASQAQQAELKASLHEQYSQELRDRLAQTIKEQRLRITTLNSRYKLKVNELKLENQKRFFTLENQIEEEKQEVAQLEDENDSLLQELNLQRNKIDGLHRYFEEKLSSSNLNGETQTQILEESFTERLENSTVELRQELDEREMELFYRDQQCSGLQAEIEQLKNENKELLVSGGNQLLIRLQDAGIDFVTVQPGVEHLSISAADISEYLNNTSDYIARKSGVDKKLYALWLDHYHSPCCTALDHEGEECGAGVEHIVELVDFHDGESNRCSEHRIFANSVAVS